MESASKYIDLDSDPPVELIASVSSSVRGFSIKHDSGTIRVWGDFDSQNKRYLTDWTELGGPVIGLHYVNKFNDDLSLIVGDKCRPKYFGARKLSVKLGEKKVVIFYWQKDYT